MPLLSILIPNHQTTVNPYEIDISKLDPAEMIAALYNGTLNPLPFPHKPMKVEEAQAEIDRLTVWEQGNRLYFDYLRNRPMKIHFGRPILDTRLYDRDNGQGAAARSLAPLLKSLENASAMARRAGDGKTEDGLSPSPSASCSTSSL